MSNFRSWPSVPSAAVLHLLLIITALTSSVAVADIVHNDREILDVKYDEYPMVVPKRGALVLDRILVALNRALMDKNEKARIPTRTSKSGGIAFEPLPLSDVLVQGFNKIENQAQSSRVNEIVKMELVQRRGHGVAGAPGAGSVGSFVPQRSRVWRCYFNAVTCF